MAIQFLAWERKKDTQKNETKALTELWLKHFPTPCWISRKQNTTLSESTVRSLQRFQFNGMRLNSFEKF